MIRRSNSRSKERLTQITSNLAATAKIASTSQTTMLISTLSNRATITSISSPIKRLMAAFVISVLSTRHFLMDLHLLKLIVLLALKL